MCDSHMAVLPVTLSKSIQGMTPVVAVLTGKGYGSRDRNTGCTVIVFCLCRLAKF